MPVGNELKRLKRDYPDLDIEFVEVTTSPVRAWKDGIRGFPSVKIGDDILSGFLLSGEQVRSFVERHLEASAEKPVNPHTDESA